ncbi:hypothetical protein NQ318_012887 [Aromia moschata]|uniref:Tyr recombinase domain-containing protein n=1 Tax=Aromia moschata TaxID=1265417 RepID=A0AAV8YEF3_9CUCU|nr:hypothetical protein NQ318_012887 [Aromia moschata]
MSDSEFSLTPPELVEAAKVASQKLLPAKLRKIYQTAYSKFMEWKMKKTCSSFSETVLLAYFSELAQQQKPSTVWSIYSIIKSPSFRRSSATLLVDSGGDLMTLKKHGGWKSSTVAEGYVDESVAHRTEIANKVFRTCGSAEITPDLRPVNNAMINTDTIQNKGWGILASGE